MSITRKILEEQGGFLSAANKSEGGCVVSLYFSYQRRKVKSRYHVGNICNVAKKILVKPTALPTKTLVEYAWLYQAQFVQARFKELLRRKY